MVPKEPQEQVTTVGHQGMKGTCVDHTLDGWQSFGHGECPLLDHVLSFALYPYYSLEENKMETAWRR